MAMKFQHALYAVGFALMLIGSIYVLENLMDAERDMDLFDALAYGFSSALGSIFAGVMVGVGGALVIDGLLQAFCKRLNRVIIAFLLSILTAIIGIGIIVDSAPSTYISLVGFFSFLAFALGMAISSTVMGIAGLLGRYAK